MAAEGKLTKQKEEEDKREAMYDKWGAREFEVMQCHMHSESVNFAKFTKSNYEL